MPLISSDQPSIESAATHAYLALSPNPIVAAKELLSEPSEVKLRVVVTVMLGSKEKRIWPVLQPLLAHENEDIRRMVCYYAIQILTKKQLQTLLQQYLAGGRYFYNVVVHIDRALYAPAAFRSQFLSEEGDHFEK